MFSNLFNPNISGLAANLSQKQTALLRATFVFWLIAKLISYKAWIAERLFPVVPLFDFLDTLPPIMHGVLFSFSLVSLALLIAFPKNTLLLFLLLTIEILSCSMDVVRWQPWEYQYLFTVFIFLINKNNVKNFITAFVFLLSLIYIFSGLHKINGAFLYSTWDNMILDDFFYLAPNFIKNLLVHYSGLFLPVVEIVCGLGLLFLKNKKIPASVLIAMHIFILLLIGPLGIAYNIVVWPWNVAMIAFLYFLFLEKPLVISLRNIWKGANPVILIFWGILPIFNFIGLWDLYLSSALYSGKEIRMDICLAKTEKTKKLNPYISKNAGIVDCGDKARLALFKWAFEEIRVPPYPEIWYYKKFKKEWSEEYDIPAAFILYSYPYKEIVIIE